MPNYIGIRPFAPVFGAFRPSWASRSLRASSRAGEEQAELLDGLCTDPPHLREGRRWPGDPVDDAVLAGVNDEPDRGSFAEESAQDRTRLVGLRAVEVCFRQIGP